MASQAEVLNYIKSTYRHEELEGGFLSVTFETDPGRSQVVFALVLEGGIICFSAFAGVDAITPAQAINATSDCPFGAGLFLNRFYALKHFAPIENIDTNEILIAFNALSIEADKIEKKLGLGDAL